MQLINSNKTRHVKKTMYNKESCRKCGWILKPNLICNICHETLHCTCNNCTNKEECIHIHNQEIDVTITNKTTMGSDIYNQRVYEYYLTAPLFNSIVS